MTEDVFDAIIVGAGVAGSSAAYRLAKAGLQVVLIERGPFPGSKNLSGGVLYGRVLHDLIPNFWESAPVERVITNQVVSFLTADSSVNLDFKTEAFNQPPYNGFTVLRARFDRWLAEQAEAAGVMLVPGIKVDGVVKRDGKVVGISADNEEMLAKVVIAADGANSFIAQQAGLRDKIPAGHAAVGVKEVIGLPREVIEERFHLNGNEGAAYNIVGFATRGVPGGGFLYTNQESLSVGLVIHLEALVERQLKPAEIFEDFLAHPMIAPLIKGGKLLEYGAHLVPEGGLKMMPPLAADGLLLVGDAAGFGVNNGFVVRGMDLAIGSAVAAAETIIEARAADDFSAARLQSYPSRLEKSFVMQDMRTYARAVDFMKNERLFEAYPALLSNILADIYRQDAQPKKNLIPTLLKNLKASKISLLDLLKDALAGGRAL
ncbi:MAG: FAD-dependent oxidoreductase [Anaerolinea sp.]|nr:FAD-dependent oxidoreductase [Anaerolinea sp.]